MHPQSKLWSTDTLIFSELDGTSGYYDENMNWVAGTLITLEVVGSLQPFKTTSQRRLLLPSGTREEDARLFYSRDLTIDLKSVKEVGNQLASKTAIDDENYILQEKGDWSNIGGNLKHRAYLLVRLAQDTLAEAT